MLASNNPKPTELRAGYKRALNITPSLYIISPNKMIDIAVFNYSKKKTYTDTCNEQLEGWPYITHSLM